jgi:hypothetical protein
MWRTQIARFQDPLLNDCQLACVSTQIWGVLNISFKSFLVDYETQKRNVQHSTDLSTHAC